MDDLAYLMQRLDEGLHETSAGFKRNGILVCGLFAVISISFAVQKAWGAAIFGLVFFVAIAFIMVKAAKRNAPERMKPVIDAVRDAPETIKLLRHYQSADSRRMFVTNWVQIATDKNHFLLKAKDWERLMAILQSRCPNARVLDK
jgi:type IV secretory pathway TrbD component